MSPDPAMKTRFKKYEAELKNIYYDIYRHNGYYDVDESYRQLIRLLSKHHANRKSSLKQADLDHYNWPVDQEIVATSLYVDLFSGNIAKLYHSIDYFKELGINLIHFMPILQPRDGDNDGGYAVKDYKNINCAYGSTDEFINLVEILRTNDIHCCIDFVVNHTAKEHSFAVNAYKGISDYQDLYLIYPNDTIPKLYEQTVPQVFPHVAPGNFTYYAEIDKWVFTSFYEFQWDLNYKNPLLFEKIIDILLYLGNMGIDMIRLDAIPFMWKEIGTSCRNLPTIHLLLRMFHLICQIVCPSVVLLGEAIVEPEQIRLYFGQTQPECDVMYNATHMVNLWNSFATRDTRLLQADYAHLSPYGNGVWINYVRCHDDIGWGFNEELTRRIGQDPFAHKQFLIHFYKGDFPGSFATGELYEYDTQTQDARNCGTMASLLGLDKGIQAKDPYQIELALKRIHLANAVLMGSDGIPLIYSGDEIGTLNDYSYQENPLKAKDSRWLHRPLFDHQKAKRRNQQGSLEYDIFQNLKKLIRLRKQHSIFSPAQKQIIFDTHNNHVYCFFKQVDKQLLIALHNFSEDRQFIDCYPFQQLTTSQLSDLITGKEVDFSGNQILLGPYEFLWLTN